LLKSQSDRLNVLAMNAIRCGTAFVFMLAILIITARYRAFAFLTPQILLSLLLSVTVGMIIGDSLFFRAQAMLGVARALPISGAYPIFTLVIAAIFLGEPVTVRAVVGTLLVVGAVIMIAMPGRSIHASRTPLGDPPSARGFMLAVGAAMGWALSTTFLRIGVSHFDVIAASCIRLPFSALVLALLAWHRGGKGLRMRHINQQALAIVALAGIIGTGLGSILFLNAIQLAGAAQAATLSATAPLWAAPMSAVLLKERVQRRVILGIVVSVSGIWLLL